jgi:hypothetical protein
MQKWGVLQLHGSFFPIWHIVGEGWLAMNPASPKVGVHLILYF